MTDKKQPPRFQPTGTMNKISDTEEFGLSSAKTRDDEIAHVLNAQTKFSALDAAEVAAYMIVVVHKTPDADGNIDTTVEAGGSAEHKILMLDTIVDALNMQFYGNTQGKEPTVAGVSIYDLFGLDHPLKGKRNE